MKFIAPLEIASKIMTLIVEAEKELILVSPYVKINDWDKMKKSLSKAVSKGVAITFIARQNTNDDLRPLKALNINPILIEDLHAKVYINDKYAIVTSQNITQYSDINSIDVGYQTENEKERLELVDFVNKYLLINIKTQKASFITIDKRDFDSKTQLKEYEIEKIYQTFNRKYKRTSFTMTAHYVFSGDLLPFADVMLDKWLTIKIDKSRTDCNKILEKLESINHNLIYDYKIYFQNTHKTHYYIDFVTTERANIDKLIDDYLNISDNILNSDIKSVLKIQRKNLPW